MEYNILYKRLLSPTDHLKHFGASSWKGSKCFTGHLKTSSFSRSFLEPLGKWSGLMTISGSVCKDFLLVCCKATGTETNEEIHKSGLDESHGRRRCSLKVLSLQPFFVVHESFYSSPSSSSSSSSSSILLFIPSPCLKIYPPKLPSSRNPRGSRDS